MRSRARFFGAGVVAALVVLGALAPATWAQRAGTVASVTVNPSIAIIGTPVTVTVNGTGKRPCMVTVSFGDGSPDLSMTGNFPLRFPHAYLRAGQFTVTATAMFLPPTAGCSGTASTTVTAAAGTVDSVTPDTGVAIVGTPVIVIVNGRRGPCPVTVSFGDGSTLSLTGNFPLQFTHAYLRVGRFTITAASPFTPGASGPCSGTASTTVTAATTTTGPFSLRRVELRFDNGRGTITVPKDRPRLKAFADVLYNGSGLLIVAWEVDGRTLAIQQEFVTFGARKVIPTPDLPSLPTFEPGLHRVTFRVIRPAASFTIPEVTYYVEAGPPSLSRVELVLPAEGAVVANSPVLFQWRSPIPAAAYRLEIFQEGKLPVFAAVTRGQSFRLPAPYERRLTAGARYAWHVKALNEDAREIGESDARNYLWQPGPSVRP